MLALLLLYFLIKTPSCETLRQEIIMFVCFCLSLQNSSLHCPYLSVSSSPYFLQYLIYLLSCLAFCFLYSWLKGRVGKNGETSSSKLEFESTQPKKICPSFRLPYRAPPPTHTNAHMTNEGTR